MSAVWSFVGVLVGINFIIGLINFARRAARFQKAARKFEKASKVAVVRLSGVIAPPAGGPFNQGQFINWSSSGRKFQEAFKIPNVKAICLEINSPGGSPVQSNLFVKRLKALQDEFNAKKNDDEKIEILAFVEDVAASGGYYIACAADRIIADENSLIGSIGVISGGFGFDKAISKIGVDRRQYTAGNMKGFGDPFLPETDAGLDLMRANLDGLHENFKNVVKSARGDKIHKKQHDTVFSGAAWHAGAAIDLGLVDEIGDLTGYCKERFGHKVEIVRMRSTPNNFLQMLLQPANSMRNAFESSLGNIIDRAVERFLFKIESNQQLKMRFE